MANIWWPLDSVRVTGEWANSPGFYSQFGQRGHNGIDLAASVGTPVYATDAGTIQAEGWGQHNNWMGSIAGIYVLIRHSWGYSGYAHLSRTIVNAGQRISKGQLIGYSGATGVGTGPHLHFETFPLYPNFGNGFAGRVNPRTHNISARGNNPAPAPAPQPAKKGLMVTHYHREDKTARSGGRTLKPGDGFYLHTTNKAPTHNAVNCIGGIGPYVLTAHLYATGAMGDKIRVKYIWQRNKKNSQHYSEDITIGADGTAHANTTFQRAAARGDSVFLRVEAPPTNKKSVNITVADSDAYLIK